MSRSWEVSNALDRIQELYAADPGYTLDRAKKLASVDGVAPEVVEFFWETLERHVERDGSDQQI